MCVPSDCQYPSDFPDLQAAGNRSANGQQTSDARNSLVRSFSDTRLALGGKTRLVLIFPPRKQVILSAPIGRPVSVIVRVRVWYIRTAQVQYITVDWISSGASVGEFSVAIGGQQAT